MSFSFPYLKYALGNLTKKTSCDMYPVVKKEAAAHYRGRIAYDSAKCVNCGMCMKVCSPGAITRTEEAITLTGDYEMVGRAEELVTEEAYFKAMPAGLPGINDDCVFCGLCAKNCPEEAITVDRPNKSWTVDTDKCVLCGKCVSKCPKKCLKL